VRWHNLWPGAKAVLSPQGLKLIEKIPTQSMEAYDAYLRGMFYWKNTDMTLRPVKYFELAKEKTRNMLLPMSAFLLSGVG
jgi:hypothetical protein